MSERKLYECSYTITYYAYTASEQEARNLLSQVHRDEYYDSEAVAVTPVESQWTPRDRWTLESSVYGPRESLTLGELIRALPAK